MASVERTAYPRFRRHLAARELHEVYTPTAEERAFAAATARGLASVLALLVLLKAFQRLGYFPALAAVPEQITAHVRACLRLPPGVVPAVTERTLYQHHRAIRAYLGVTAWGARGRQIALRAVAGAAEAKDIPADLVNVAIEALVRHRCELPAFGTLDRLARRVRALVNRRLFRRVAARLSAEAAARLDALLDPVPGQRRSAYARLKHLPRRPTRTHFGMLLAHLQWLEDVGAGVGLGGDVASGEAGAAGRAPLLGGLPPAKVRHLAAEARALDASELNDVAAPKRHVLLLCLLARAQAQARDDLVTTFLKRMARLHVRAREELAALQARQRETTEALVAAFAEVLHAIDGAPADAEAGRVVRRALAARGGPARLLADCEAVAATAGDNHLPLLWRFYRSQRGVLFGFARALRWVATSQDASVLRALDVLLRHQESRGEWLPMAPQDVDLSFASGPWRRLVLVRPAGPAAPGREADPASDPASVPRAHGASSGRARQRAEAEDTPLRIARRHFEVCVFSHLAAELRSGDVCVTGADVHADYRDQLLPWESCAPQVAAYCRELGFPETADGFVAHLRRWLADTAETVDAGYPDNGQVTITPAGEPVLRRPPRRESRASAQALEAALLERLPERTLLDLLCNVDGWTRWTRHFGPLAGAEPKLDDPTGRYLLTTFAYGCNLGPAQAARHMRGLATAHMLSFVNRRHVSVAALNAALKDLVNAYHRCGLPTLWGDGTTAAADGTKYGLAENNLVAEYHIRYGGSGGIASHHVADTYVALFSHFIPCGVWEAVYLLDGLLQNTSDVQPDTVHTDTQGQSAPVFGLAYLLGIQLMPRIRNWKDLRFYRPSKDARYRHIDALLSETVDWDLLATHWPDLLRVVLSIRAGTVSSAVLLHKLGTYSRKNRLYQAFRELGRVVRTVFLLRYLADQRLREQITAATNKAEAYRGFAKWRFFGGDGVIADNDPEEQEKRIKYNDLVANAAILHTVVDMTAVLQELAAEGYQVHQEDVATLSPDLTRALKRFGDYVLPTRTLLGPLPVAAELALPGTPPPPPAAPALPP